MVEHELLYFLETPIIHLILDRQKVKSKNIKQNLKLKLNSLNYNLGNYVNSERETLHYNAKEKYTG